MTRHLRHSDQTPIPEHTRKPFEALAELIDRDPRFLVLDAGCGTGQSTLALAKKHPDAWVIGLDKSAHRLRHVRPSPLSRDNHVVWLRADQPAFYRLARTAGWRLTAHYLFYPNPWPKSQHLLRRWHGHPVWPTLLALGGRLELRTNWLVYAEEMARALTLSGHDSMLNFVESEPVSPFEAKYLQRGHRCHRLVAQL